MTIKRSIILRAMPSAAGPLWLLGLPFRGRGASILLFWETISAPREHPGGPFLAPQDNPGRPWEQQDGLEMVLYGILFDFGLILGPVYINFWSSRTLKFRFFGGSCFQVIFLSISETKFRRLGLPNRGFRMEGIATTYFFMKIVLNEFRVCYFVVCWSPWGPFF